MNTDRRCLGHCANCDSAVQRPWKAIYCQIYTSNVRCHQCLLLVPILVLAFRSTQKNDVGVRDFLQHKQNMMVLMTEYDRKQSLAAHCTRFRITKTDLASAQHDNITTSWSMLMRWSMMCPSRISRIWAKRSKGNQQLPAKSESTLHRTQVHPRLALLLPDPHPQSCSVASTLSCPSANNGDRPTRVQGGTADHTERKPTVSYHALGSTAPGCTSARRSHDAARALCAGGALSPASPTLSAHNANGSVGASSLSSRTELRTG